jgi:glycine/D-amino acid oxidase-like deaminating enzyme
VRPDRRDIVVVGCDLTGLIIAELAAAAGHSVDVLAAPQVKPTTVGSLESGLLELDGEADWRAYLDGIQMLEYFGYPRPAARSILSFSRQDEVTAFLNRANAKGLLRRVARITPNEALRGLGVFFVGGRIHLSVPDVPFPLGELTRLAHERAKSRGVRFHHNQVLLQADGRATNGYVIKTNETYIEPAITIVSSDADTPVFLEQLRLHHDIVAIRSVALEIHSSAGLPTALLADGSTGVVVASLDRRQCPPYGQLLIRRDRSLRSEIGPEDVTGTNSASEKELLMRYVASSLSIDRLPHRFVVNNTSGVFQNGGFTCRPTIFAPPAFPGLLFATPGRPSQALSQARRALSTLSSPKSGRRKAA